MTSTASGCGCSGSVATGTTDTGSDGRERVRYFPRQLVGAADLTQDQLYFREKARRHNRMLHGWGIVCGIRVAAIDGKPGFVAVEPGYALGPYGDEILLDQRLEIDLGAQDLNGDTANGCVPADPWCADVRAPGRGDKPVYLAIAYAEYQTRPVTSPTSGCGCGCDDSGCEYSRIRESYRIRVLDALPGTYDAVMAPPAFLASVSCRMRAVDNPNGGHPNGGGDAADTSCACPACSDCPSEPWVVLADITLQGSAVTAIDCDAHRRYVASFRDFFYACGPADGRGISGSPVQLAVDPDAIRLLKPALISRLAGGALTVDAVTDQDAVGLAGVTNQSALADKLADVSIAQVAGESRDAFVTRMSDGVAGAASTAIKESAATVWDQAAAMVGVLARYR